MTELQKDWLCNLPGARDLGSVFIAEYVQLAEAMRAALAKNPSFGPVFAAATPEVLAAYDAKIIARLKLAFAGDWAPYAEGLRRDGVGYAHLGLTFGDWFSLVTGFVRPITPMLFARFGADPARLELVLEAMHQFRDQALAVLTKSFIETSEQKVRDREAEVQLLRAQSAALAAENHHVHEASRLKSEFLANMSHELRTPLNAILGFSELLQHGEVGPLSAQQSDFVSDIHQSGKHLLHLITDLLDLSKIEAGKLEFSPEVVSLAAVVEEVRRTVSVTASQAVSYRVHIDPSVETVELDRSRLIQVLYNYLSNALKFTPAGGCITIRMLPEGSTAFRVEVTDDGPGIAQDDQRRLFTAFEQLDRGRSKRHGGTGLGLALTRRLVEAQGGSVGVCSTEGQGSTFFAVLPRAPSTAPVA